MPRRIILTGVVFLHAFVLVAAVSVPGYAIGGAIWAILSDSASESLAEIVSADRWLALLANTAIVCGAAVVTTMVLGGLFGWITARTDMPGRRLLVGGAILGACIPIYISVVFVFSFIPVTRLHGSAMACGVLYGLLYTPLAIVILGAAFRAVDRDLEEQALLDAGLPSVFLRVTLPQTGWGIVTLGMMIVLLVGTDYTITDMLMVRTFAEEVYTQFAMGRAQAGPLMTSTPVFIAMAGMLVGLQGRYRLLGENTPWQFGARPRVVALGRWRVGLAFACVLITAVLVGLPTVSLLRRIDSINGFFAATRGLRPELLLSALLATAGGLIVVLPSVGLAWSAVRGGRLRWPVCTAVVLLLALPAPAAGISLIGMLNRDIAGSGWPGVVYDSPVVIVMGYVVRFLPIGVLLLLPAVQRVPRDLESAARIDGCHWLATQWHVYWPAIARHVVVVWLVVIILCFSEVGATVLLAPPGWATASVRAFTLIHYGVYRDLAVLAILSVGSLVLPWLLLVVLLRRSQETGRSAS
ncbi:MAG: iron ABC transporter permease [Phycisphaerae bacterium]|nr:iron ABC transporter permease [Phycisphaerae bacterium]